MRSRRSRFEFACRVCAFAALGWLLGTSVFPPAPRGVDRATDMQLDARLAAWTRMPRTVALHAELASTPSGATVDWLAALERAGHVVSWSGNPRAVAMSASALADPTGGIRVDVAAPRGTAVVLHDAVGVIDTIHVASAGGTAIVPVAVGQIEGRAGPQRMDAAMPDSLRARSVVVVGAAGWEGKFVVSALEERGWPVVSRFSVAPKVDVTEGVLSLDTSHVAAVVVVDTAGASLGPAIERFVRSGGGLVLAGASGSSAALAPFAAGAVGPRLRPNIQPKDTITLGSTGFYPVVLSRADAVVLDRRAGGIAMAARRIGAGRVIQVGYDDSWRWRMAGAPGADRAHRDWWSRVVGSVAYMPGPRGVAATGESAPLARLVDRVGPRRDAVGGARRTAIDPRWLLGIIMIFLLTEWTSRRMRGLK